MLTDTDLFNAVDASATTTPPKTDAAAPRTAAPTCRTPSSPSGHRRPATTSPSPGGPTVTATIDGRVVSTYDDPTPELAGRVNLGAGFYKTCFDNLKVKTVPGYSAYASSLIDNMDSAVGYTGLWSRQAANGDAMDWHRTTSTSATVGSTIIVPFDGTGIGIIGGNNGSAILDVSVDGAPLASKAASVSSGKRQATYTLRGLPDGSHTATFTLKSGTLVADAFNAISAEVTGPVDTTALQEALTAAGSPAQADYSAASWSVFNTTRSAARAALGVRPASTPWEPGSWHNG
jgi:hypothetical protein